MKKNVKENKKTNIDVIILAGFFLLAVFYFVLWPLIQRGLMNHTCKQYGDDYRLIRKQVMNNLNCKSYDWACENSNGDFIWIKEIDGSKSYYTNNNGCH